MFKNALKVATAFGVLLAGYAGYVRVFALVAAGMGRPKAEIVAFAVRESKSQKRSHDLAVLGYGPDDWSAKYPQICMYNAERGFWMYASNYRTFDDGKKVEFTPFHIIWVSKDGKALKTATSAVATMTLDKPLGLNANPGGSGSSLHVVHAVLEGDVSLRDDKGTADPGDDLRVGPLTFVEYDEPTLQITGNDRDVVHVEDRGLHVTGEGLQIKLRPKDDASAGQSFGFNGAETAYLKRKVHIVMDDVGAGGILPGAPEGKPRAKGAKGAGPTPLRVNCDGQMEINLPKPRLFVRVGPPAPQRPTFARFHRNVEVLRGKPGQTPDQLTCDDLFLTLVPGEKGAPPEADAPAPDGTLALETRGETGAPAAPAPAGAGEEGALGNLALREADATGHNVRLVSAAQEMNARCNQLIHRKYLPDAPDETYFRGDTSTRLVVEKRDVATEGPDKGKVTGLTTIRTIDAKVFDDGRGNESATIVARSFGERSSMEFRPGPDKPVSRTAHWSDTLTFQTEPAAANNPTAPPRKRITLTGRPDFADLDSQSTLDARRVVVVWLRPKPPEPTAVAKGVGPGSAAEETGEVPAEPAAKPAGSSFEIDQLVALEDVHLTSPGKTLTARERLDAIFTAQPAGAAVASVTDKAKDADKGKAPAPAPETPEARKADDGSALAKADAPADKPAAGPKEPATKAVATKVYAELIVRPTPAGEKAEPGSSSSSGMSLAKGPSQKTEIDKVRLRGGVVYHQDPEAGKVKGTDVVGEALDLTRRGDDLMQFIVFNNDPSAPVAPNAPAPAATPAEKARDRTSASKGLSRVALRPVAGAARPGFDPFDEQRRPLARVETDEMIIRGKVIGLDQKTDQAWVDGRGSVTQLAASGLLTDKGLQTTSGAEPRPANAADGRARPGAKAKPKPEKKSPMTVTFTERMRFYGRPVDPKSPAVGRAEFYGTVHAETDDATIDCTEVMRTYLDRTVKLARPAKPAPAPGDDLPTPAEPEPKAEIAVVQCVDDVVLVNLKREEALPGQADADRAILEKQRIEGNELIYQKATGRFYVPGEGEVFLYQREGSDTQLVPSDDKPAGNAPKPARETTKPGSRGPGARAPGTVRPTAGPPTGGAPVRRAPAVAGRSSPRDPGELYDRTRAAEAAKKLANALPPMVLTHVKFSDSMVGRLGSGKESDKTETRMADFFGDVEAVHAKVAGPDSLLDPDDLPLGAEFMTSQVMRVVSEPTPPTRDNPDPSPRYYLKAWENAHAVADDKIIEADKITFDSLNNLFWAYGEGGRDVLIAQQVGTGMPAQIVKGSAAWHNHNTGESNLIDPKNAVLLDQRTGERPKPVPPKDKKDKPKLPKRQKFKNPYGTFERKGFTGQ